MDRKKRVKISLTYGKPSEKNSYTVAKLLKEIREKDLKVNPKKINYF
jgi:hypothetical protein